MRGRLLQTSGTPTGWEGMATMDLSNRVARVLLGGGSAGTSVTLQLNNIPTEFGSPVTVRIERVHTTGNEVLWSEPILHSQQNVAVSGGSLSLPISGFPARTALMVTVTRSDLPARAARPTFHPPRRLWAADHGDTADHDSGRGHSLHHRRERTDRGLADLHGADQRAGENHPPGGGFQGRPGALRSRQWRL